MLQKQLGNRKIVIRNLRLDLFSIFRTKLLQAKQMEQLYSVAQQSEEVCLCLVASLTKQQLQVILQTVYSHPEVYLGVLLLVYQLVLLPSMALPFLEIHNQLQEVYLEISVPSQAHYLA